MARRNDVVITTSQDTGKIHITFENYLIDHEISDLTAEDFLLGG